MNTGKIYELTGPGVRLRRGGEPNVEVTDVSIKYIDVTENDACIFWQTASHLRSPTMWSDTTPPSSRPQARFGYP